MFWYGIAALALMAAVIGFVCYGAGFSEGFDIGWNDCWETLNPSRRRLATFPQAPTPEPVPEMAPCPACTGKKYFPLGSGMPATCPLCEGVGSVPMIDLRGAKK